MMSKQHRLTLSITQEQYEYLEQYKERFDISFASQIRGLITREINGTVTITETITRSRTITGNTTVSKQTKDVKDLTSELASNPLFLKMKERVE